MPEEVRRPPRRQVASPPPPRRPPPPRFVPEEDVEPPPRRRRRRRGGGCGLSFGVLIFMAGVSILVIALILAVILMPDLRDAIGISSNTATPVAAATAVVAVTQPPAGPTQQLVLPTPVQPTPVPPTATPAPPTATPFPTPDPVVVEAQEVLKSVGMSWKQDGLVNLRMQKFSGTGQNMYIIWGAIDTGFYNPNQNLFDPKVNPATQFSRTVKLFVQDVPDNSGCISLTEPTYKFQFSGKPEQDEADRKMLNQIASEARRGYDEIVAQANIPREQQPLADNGPTICGKVTEDKGFIAGNFIAVIFEQDLSVPTPTAVIRVP